MNSSNSSLAPRRTYKINSTVIDPNKPTIYEGSISGGRYHNYFIQGSVQGGKYTSCQIEGSASNAELYESVVEGSVINSTSDHCLIEGSLVGGQADYCDCWGPVSGTTRANPASASYDTNSKEVAKEEEEDWEYVEIDKADEEPKTRDLPVRHRTEK